MMQEVCSYVTGATWICGTCLVEVGGLVGIIWFIGYLFTLAFAQLVWWQALFALLIWPYNLGLAAR